MLPSPQVCERARQARDPRFDGRFFIGVVTTGIYCRPVCPARMPARDNVRFFPTAAAAQEAGYRPCLRCRPEVAAPTPEWNLGSETVVRAFRRIGEGALDSMSVAELAGEIGLSSRQLQRLCVEHLGATPAALARTRRLHLAKRLIDDTRLSFTDVALIAGYSSVRRFNDAIKQAYQRSPRALRRQHTGAVNGQCEGIALRMNYRGPFDPSWLMDFFARRAIPGIERVDADCYERTFELEGDSGRVRVSFDTANDHMMAEIRHPHPRALGSTLERVRRMFDLATDSAVVDGHLAADAMLRPVISRYPGLRVPGAWDGFELAVRAVVGQQVSVKGAVTVTHRLVERFGEKRDGWVGFPTAEALLHGDPAEFSMPRQRSQALKGLCEKVIRGELRFDGSMSTDALRDGLLGISGIGPWTAGYITMRALSDPDAMPAADLVLMRAAGVAKAAELEARAEAWRPWRAYAVMYLWKKAGLAA